MCTVSWLRTQAETTILFNRDEQRTRPLAQPPQKLDGCTVKTCCPIDPQGGGTWIFGNASGRICCLLNNYDAGIAPRRADARSRGLLMTEFAQAPPPYTEVSTWIADQLYRHNYPPFHLLVFDVDRPPGRWTWDGNNLDELKESANGMFTTSAWNSLQVAAFRKQLWNESGANSPSGQKEFHEYQFSEDTGYAPFMARQDAHTVSISTLSRSSGKLTFHYTPIADDNTFLESRSYSMPWRRPR